MDNYLGRRVNKYRTYYRKGTLSQEKIDRLTNIGFQFILKEIISWDDKFIELKEYYKTYKTNDCIVFTTNSNINLYNVG